MSRNKSEANREYIRNVIAVIRNRPCVDCSTYKEGEMSFDHLPGFTKRFNIGSVAGKETLKSILREILKCEVVCLSCHVKRETKRRLSVKKVCPTCNHSN